MQHPREALWKLVPLVRPGERGRFLFFLSLSGLIGLGQTLGLVGTEALFLTRVGIAQLPQAFVLGSLLTVAGSLAYGLLVGRTRNDDFFVGLLVGSALVLGAALVPASLGWSGVYTALFAFFFLTQALLLNHYWTFSWDYFDVLASKRLFPMFLAGSSVAGVLGAAASVGLARRFPAESLIAGWAAALLAAALLLRLARRPLRRWGPLELEEADETSLVALRAAARYVRSSSLARWLSLSTVAMVLALFTSQYLYSDLLRRAFPDAADMASFLGVYLVVTNGIEIVVELWLAPALIRRAGVASANLVHPLITISSFAALALDYRLAAGLYARANREMLDNALAQTVRVLIYNAIPQRFRGRLRLLQEGIVFYAAMAAAGALLLVASERLSPQWLCAAGAATALVYLGANLALRREYLRTLVGRLREGRLDLAELGADLGAFEAERLAGLWRAALASPSHRVTRADLELPAILARHGLVEPLVEASTHADARVRVACMEALGAAVAADPTHAVRARDALVAGLRDPSAAVRLVAVRASAALESGERELEARFADEDPDVSAEAARASGAAGRTVLDRMLASGDARQVIAALGRVEADRLEDVLARARAQDPGVRAAALERASQLARPVPLGAAELAKDVSHADARVRLATVGALATRGDAASLSALAGALADASPEVRRRAERALAGAGAAALPTLQDCLRDARTPCVRAAIDALGAMATPASRALLGEELRRRARQGCEAMLAQAALAGAAEPRVRFLLAALEDCAERSRRLAFAVLERLESAAVMRTVARVLRFAGARARGDALEVLSNLGDRESARLLIPMLEAGPLADRAAALAAVVRGPRTPGEALELARRSEDRWLRLAAAHYTAPAPGAALPEAREEIMDRLLVLREVPLFASLLLEQLEAIGQIMSEARYLSGEVLCREGDLGGELFLLIEGELQAFRGHGTPGERLLSTQRAVSYSGEMAILADEPRSATLVASDDSRVLVLGGEQLKDLIVERPEISFEIFRVLSRRVRAAEERL